MMPRTASSAGATAPASGASRALASSLAAKTDAAVQKLWLRPGLWEGTGQLPSVSDNARATFVAWNIRQAWCVTSSRDPRDRQDRIYSILDAAHTLGVSVAALTETGLASSEELGEEVVARWAASRKCPARLWTARRLRSRHAAAGSSAGIAVVAFGAWAARGGTSRAWTNGRGLFVEFALTGHAPGETPGRSSVAVGAIYGPATGGLGEAHEKFRNMVSDEWHDCRERGLAPLFLGDLNFAPTAFDRASAVAAPLAEAAAWLTSEPWCDVWRAMLPNTPGFSFERGATASRIDFALLAVPADASPLDKPAAATGIWLGPLLEEAPGQSDHRPLLLELDVQAWSGGGSAGCRRQKPHKQPAAAWPSASLFARDAEELAAVNEAAAAMDRLPTKLDWQDLAGIQDGEAMAVLVAECLAEAEALGADTSTEELSAVFDSLNDKLGKGLSDELNKRLYTSAADDLSTQQAAPDAPHRATNGAPEQRGGEPRWGTAFREQHLLQLWAARVRRFGAGVLKPGAFKVRVPGAWAADPPQFVLDLWLEASQLAAGQSRTKRASSCWAAGVPRPPLVHQGPGWQPMPDFLDSYDWFNELYRRELKDRFKCMRYAGGNNKRAARKARDAKLAADVRAGRTGGIFMRVTGPKNVRIPANSIWIPVEGEDGEPGMEIQTDQDGVLKGARIYGHHTTGTSGEERENCRTDGMSEADLDAGDLPPRFDALDFAEVKALMSPARFRDPIPLDRLMAEWTGPRLREALRFAKSDSAPGSSGLSYRLLANSSDAFLAAVAAFMQACQRCRRLPKGGRHSVVKLIPKSGAGGASLEGARQICLIEVLVKLISAGIGRAAMDHWEEFDYLDPAQSGFLRFRSAADVAAAVNAVIATHRRSKTPLFVISADIEKAFQRVPHWAIERALRRLGFTEEAAKFWMETERGRDGELGTCQFSTDAGLTESFEVECGVRMGESGSTVKFLVWMDILLCWARTRHHSGHSFTVQTDGEEVSVELGMLAFADDLLLMGRTLAEAQGLLDTVDRFLTLFGVNLQPAKSNAMKVGEPWQPGDQISLSRNGVLVPLRRMEPSEGMRYLGVWFQADGAWHAMEAHLKAKITQWTARLRRAGRFVTAPQAALFLQSKVGGLLRFAFAAAPLSAAFARWVDGKIGRAIVGRTGGAVGANLYVDISVAFAAKDDDGLGVFSAEALRREVIVCSTLTRLSMAAASRQGAGARAARQPHGFAWLFALDARTAGAGTVGEFLWRPDASGAGTVAQDHLDATREILTELDLRIRDDRARPLPPDRRLWDIAVDEVLAVATPPAPTSTGAPAPDPVRCRTAWVTSWLQGNTSRSRIPRRYVGSLVGPCGRRLLSRDALFPHLKQPPAWYLAVERTVLADVPTRALLPA